MLRRVPLSQTPEDVVASVLDFPRALKESNGLQDRLPYARAWYAVRGSDGFWVFAPSKWAGYMHMTAAAYLSNEPGWMDGRKTEKHLQKWFSPLDHQSREYAELHNKLSEFMADYGKLPSAAARISVISSRTNDTKEGDDLVELLLRVVKGLDHGQQARIKSALSGRS